MPTPTYDLLASSVLTTAASSVTFDNISQDYRDLVLVCETNNGASIASFRLIFNSDSVTEVEWVQMRGDGSSATSGSFGGVAYFGGVTANNDRPLHIVQIMDYSATDKHTTGLYRGNGTTNGVYASAFRYPQNTAISTLKVETGTNTYAAGSTFHLYGIKA